MLHDPLWYKLMFCIQRCKNSDGDIIDSIQLIYHTLEAAHLFCVGTEVVLQYLLQYYCNSYICYTSSKKTPHKKLLEIISGKGYADSSLYVYFLKETKRHNRCVDSMKSEQNFHNIISSSSPANSSDPFIGTVWRHPDSYTHLVWASAQWSLYMCTVCRIQLNRSQGDLCWINLRDSSQSIKSLTVISRRVK